MAQEKSVSVENNFTKGLVTESTGLNFPTNAATDTDNCVYTLVGDVNRRKGFNLEENYTLTDIDRTGKATSLYKWNNAGGDGLVQLVVSQVGNTLYFYKSSDSTVASPLSSQLLVSTVNLNDHIVVGSTKDISTVECSYSDGNGYLFVYHPYCEPTYCVYEAGTVTGNSITLYIRDFLGVPEIGVASNFRPLTLTNEHKYNLLNQGWSSAGAWGVGSGTSNPYIATGGPLIFNIGTSSLPISPGDDVRIINNFNGYFMVATVDGYSGTNLTVTVYNWSPQNLNPNYPYNSSDSWTIVSNSTGNIDTWRTTVNNYPSNSDVWWRYKNSAGGFSPGTTYQNVTSDLGEAPKGHFIISAFNQNRASIANVPDLTPIQTDIRPKIGTWFAGRVWYSGVDASQIKTGNAPYYSWSESIYFSQIITDVSQFGKCHQANDPTSEKLFDLLPTDGGVIQIQGCGSVYKLFPIQNGLLVFAANGIWFITGSQGIGFSANDYTVTKISSIESISSTSFVNVKGLPYFWNEEGIYTVTPAQQGLGLTVESITVGVIQSFYDQIPKSSKKFVRGDYHPIDYVIQWTYRDTEASDINSSYEFNRILNYNVYNKAFYPYSISTLNSVHGVIYVSYPGGGGSPDPSFKYLISTSAIYDVIDTTGNLVIDSGGNQVVYGEGVSQMSFAEEYDETYLDWGTETYDSYFITGYSLKGQAHRKFQVNYVYVFSRNDVDTAYKIQGLWDFANSGNSGRWTNQQLAVNNKDYFRMAYKRHKIRGSGLVLQTKVSSVDGQPFDIMGWAVVETVNAGV